MRANNYYTRNIKSTLLPLVCFLGLNLPLHAIELSVIKQKQQLAIHLTDIHYPNELLIKEVNSGLQSRFFSIITFEKAGEVFNQCSYSINVTYDLWDEHYLIEQIVDRGLVSSFVISDVKTVFNMLKNLEIQCPLKDLQPEQNMLIKAQVFVNPVEHKRIEKIKTWINSSQGHKASKESTVNHADVGSNQSTIINVDGQSVKSIIKGSTVAVRPRFEKLFDKILSQYAGPSDVVSLWKSSQASIKINLRQVKDEK